MGKAAKRELWDITAVLRLTLMQCGFAKFDRLPKLEEMNPVRYADGEDEMYEEEDDKRMERALSRR